MHHTMNPPPRPSVFKRRSTSANGGFRVLLLPVMLVFVCAAAMTSASADATEQEATVTVGGETLALQAKGKRSMLFGSVDIYSVGVYASREVNSAGALRNQQLTRAVRVNVLYDGGMPEKIPSEWWRELIPALDKQQQQKLREAFARLSPGEDVWITYAPSTGTLFRAAGNTVVTDPGDGLMNAVLDLWFGATPVSSELHDELVTQLRQSDR